MRSTLWVSVQVGPVSTVYCVRSLCPNTCCTRPPAGQFQPLTSACETGFGCVQWKWLSRPGTWRSPLISLQRASQSVACIQYVDDSTGGSTAGHGVSRVSGVELVSGWLAWDREWGSTDPPVELAGVRKAVRETVPGDTFYHGIGMKWRVLWWQQSGDIWELRARTE